MFLITGVHLHSCRVEAYSTCTTVFENFNNIDGGENFVAGQWYHVAVAMGSNVNGKKSVFLMAGSQPGIRVCIACIVLGSFKTFRDGADAIHSSTLQCIGLLIIVY